MAATPTRALIFSGEAPFLEVFQRGLADAGIEAANTADAPGFLARIAEVPYDVLVVDCDCAGATTAVLPSIRTATCHRDAVVIAAASGGSSNELVALGAHIALFKPVAVEMVARHARDAFRLAAGEKRRYNRYPLETRVSLSVAGKPLEVASVNLSEGGMCVQLPGRLNMQDPLEVQFQPPGQPQPLLVHGVLAWQDPQLRAGIRFVRMSWEERSFLERALAEYAAKVAPLA